MIEYWLNAAYGRDSKNFNVLNTILCRWHYNETYRLFTFVEKDTMNVFFIYEDSLLDLDLHIALRVADYDAIVDSRCICRYGYGYNEIDWWEEYEKIEEEFRKMDKEIDNSGRYYE